MSAWHDLIGQIMKCFSPKEKQLWQANKRVEKEENIRNGGHSCVTCDIAVNKLKKANYTLLTNIYLNYYI